MAVADQPSGLTDIASTLPQDEIPFKLRCAICNKLAVNAFRLPCCDQAVCENCQTSLPDTCPVCAHTPISADLCKPNKALRTTLKAFLRTEEKKREKERQQATPTTPVDTTPADATAKQETPQPTHTPQDSHVGEKEPAPTSDSLPVQPSVEQPAEPIADNAPDEQPELPAESQAQNEEAENDTSAALEKTDAAEQNDHGPTEEASTKPADSQPTTQPPVSGQMPPNPMAMNMGGGFGNMSWNPAGDFNPMSQFMPNGMFNFQNPMGMPGMAMDPMAQGMFGGYGMNMNGMSNGMNIGTGFDAGQGMYGGWDGSQSNLWNGGQDKFNPTAFANGMGQQYGGPSGFGGFNLPQPQQFPNQNYQNAYYGPGARGNIRGRGRGGFFYGRGRGGFTGQSHANFAPDANGPAFQDQNSFNQEAQSQSHEGPSAGPDGEAKRDGDVGEREGTAEGPGKETTADTNADEMSGEAKPAGMPSADTAPDESQLRGIPTIDSLDQTNQMGFAPTGPTGMAGNMGIGFGRGGYMHGGFAGGRGGFGPYMPGPNIPSPSGPGVEGAPAAPRAMRQGLPNTSVLRHRGYQPQAQGAGPAGKPAEASQNATPGPQDPAASRAGSGSKSRSRSKARSPSRSRSRSPPSSWRRQRRHRSRSYDPSDDDRERRRERRRRHRREDDYDEQSADEYGRRTRSPSIESSRRSSRRRDRDRDRRSRRSHRSRRHRTRSPSRGGDHDRLSVVPEEDDTSARDVPEQPTRSHRSRKDRSSRHDDDRDRDRDREARRRDRERHERHRERHREREKKRSRRDRDRTESPGVDSDYTSHHRSSRRVRRSRGDHDGNHEDVDDKETEPAPEKDPHTLEREARNRERLLKEQQRRDAMHGERPSRKRDSRSERALHGTRRVSYKYEDEESDAARAERVESEREASRWA